MQDNASGDIEIEAVMQADAVKMLEAERLEAGNSEEADIIMTPKREAEDIAMDDADETPKIDAGTDNIDEPEASIAASPVNIPDTTIIEEKTNNKGKKRKATKASNKKKKVTIQPVKEEEFDEQELELNAAEEDGAAEEDEAEEDDKLYCICKAKFNDDEESRSMLACDNCDEWYHASCMKIPEEKVKFVDQFICSLCELNSTQRTTMKQPCSRDDCDGIAPVPLSKYCCQECGILVAASKIAKIKSANGLSIIKAADKMLQVPLIKNAKKTEAKIVWTPGHNKRKWLESILGQNVSPSILNDVVSKLEDMAQLEELTRLEKRHRQVEGQMQSANFFMDVLHARTTLLQLADERLSSLDLIGEEEGAESRVSVKKSKGKRVKQEDVEDKPAVQGRGQGQLRCGYDERLSWDDERLYAWSKTDTAKLMLAEEKTIPLDGSVYIEGEGITPKTIKICGQSKRKCKRHGDWSVIRGADMEAESEMRRVLYNTLTAEEQELSKRIEDVKVAIKESIAQQGEREKQQDALLARQLADHGSRRSIHI
jgi:COMPASS component SPP1